MSSTDLTGFQRSQETAPARPAGGLLGWLGRRLVAWEDWLTFVIALLALLAVAQSIQDSHWVSNMPPLALVGFLAMALGMFLARAPLPQLLAHLLSLMVGGAVVFWQALTVVEGGNLGARVDDLYFRMSSFFDIARKGLISNDTLPFIIMVVGLTWLAVYFFAWSVFHWRNAWLGLIPGGIALFVNSFYFQEGSLTLLFVLFAFAALLLVMRMNLLRRVGRWQEQGTPHPEFISISFLHVTAWATLFLLVAAWLIPAGGETQPFTGLWVQASRPFRGVSNDFGRLFVRVQARQIMPVHSYADFLPFKSSVPRRDRVVLEVNVDQGLDLAAFPFLYGAAYTRYSSAGWLMGDRVGVEASVPSLEAAAQRIQNDPTLGKARPFQTEVTVVGSRRPVLFSIGHPVAASVPFRYQLPRLATNISPGREESLFRLMGLVLESKENLDEGASYRSLGAVPEATAKDLRQASASYPSWVRSRYLQLPSELPQRVRDLAQQVSADAPTPYDKAVTIANYLRANYPIAYKLPELPVGRDAVDYFLFESKQGFFDYHASALAVMLRAVGVPSRLAVGFLLGERDRSDDSRFVIRDRHAYAWAEAYFSGIGWVPFTSSPDLPPLASALEESPLDGSGIDPLLGDLDDIFTDDGLFPADNAQGQQTSREGGGAPLALWGALATLGALALMAAAGRFAWEQPLARLPYPQQLWEKTACLASWAGVRPRPHQTPREYAQEIRRRAADAGDTGLLADAYGRSRFGRQALSQEDQEQLRRAWERLRNALLMRILRRGRKAGAP